MSASPFTQLPVAVQLRNRSFATIHSVRGEAPFIFIGRHGLDTPEPHLIGADLSGLGRHDRNQHEAWRRDGRWQENGEPHPLDIVGVVVERNGSILKVVPYAPAAGQKGPL